MPRPSGTTPPPSRPAPWARVVRALWASLALGVACADKGAGTRAEAGADEGTPSTPMVGVGVTTGTQPLDDAEDNDCDGLIDEPDEIESRPLFRADGDRDRYQVGAPVAACLAPAGMAPFSGFEAPVDCDDSDGRTNPGRPEQCGEAGDEDCDGLANCDDPDCAERCDEDCAHEGDEDADGLADCADPDCAGVACVEDCADPADNDRDGRDDCADPDCPPGLCAEDCLSGEDRDRDRAIGCDDPDCFGPACAEDCETPGDEDADGLADCEDADCADRCVEDCAQEGDEDADGLPDCADDECALHLRCWTDRTVSLNGGGDLDVNASFRRDVSSSARATATLDLSSVQIHGLSASGERSCAIEIPHLRLQQGYLWNFWMRTYIWAGPVSADHIVGLTPDCPAPDPAELLDLDLGLSLDLQVRRSAGAPLIRSIDGALVVGAGGRWAPVGLHTGPLSASRVVRSTWFYFSHYQLTVSAQTATIDSFAPLE